METVIALSVVAAIVNGFLPGRLNAAALTALNAGQVPTSFLRLLTADRLQGRRAMRTSIRPAADGRISRCPFRAQREIRWKDTARCGRI